MYVVTFEIRPFYLPGMIKQLRRMTLTEARELLAQSRRIPRDGRIVHAESLQIIPAEWVSPELAKHAVPDEFGRTSPFAVYVYYPATQREMVMRNQSLESACKMADREADAGHRVHVSLDTCG
jgi:hypothetical protein